MKRREKFKKIVVMMMVTALIVSSVQLNVKAGAGAAQPMGANVALNKTVIAPDATENTPKIVDGNTTSGWQATKNMPNEQDKLYDPQTWIIDLEDIYTIDKIKLYWEAACAKKFNIYVSETNEENPDSWTLVTTEVNGVKGENTYRFDTVTARYVKLDLQYRAMDYGYNLYEAEVYTIGSVDPAFSENLAKKATATVSNFDGTNTGDKAIDGDEGTMWQAPMQYEGGIDIPNEIRAVENITLQWEEPQTISAIKMVWGGGFLTGYKFQISEDGETWNDIYEVTDGKGGETRNIKLDQSISTKYLRMQGVTFGAWRVELKELQVFDETNILVDKLYLNNSEAKLNLDDENALTKQLEVRVNPSNAADQSVKWTSSDESVATVDENGLVTGLKNGITTITATSNSNTSVKAECRVVVVNSIAKTNVTASKVEGEKAINITWTAVDNAVSYELYKSGEEELIYTGTSLTYKDESLTPGTYSYYVKAIAPVDSDIYADSISEVTEGVLIPVDVTGVTLSKDNADIFIGDSEQLTATVAPDNATNQEVNWTTSDETIAIVDENGKITAVKEGTATITATTVDGEFTATCEVNAVPVDAESITLNKIKDTVELNSIVQLEATVNPSNTTYKDVTWTTKDESIATVDESGLVTAKAVGSTVITATAVSGVTAEFIITVKITPTKVVLDKTELNLTEGDKATLAATVESADATDKTVKWTSDNESVATVDENGNVTAVKAGTAYITVITNDGNVKATCKVNVNSVTVPTTQEQGKKIKAPARAKITKVTAKKKAANNVKLSLKKIKNAKGYEIQILSKKNAKKALVKKIVKKVKVTVKSKKLKNNSKLFVKVRAYVLDAKGNKVYGKWSKVEKIKIKK